MLQSGHSDSPPSFVDEAGLRGPVAAGGHPGGFATTAKRGSEKPSLNVSAGKAMINKKCTTHTVNEPTGGIELPLRKQDRSSLPFENGSINDLESAFMNSVVDTQAFGQTPIYRVAG